MFLKLLLIKWVSKNFSVTVTASSSNDKPLQTDLQENAHNACQNKGQFLQSKQSFLLKKFLCDIKYSGSGILQDSVLNDKNFMSRLTKLLYGREIFSDIRRKYNSGNIFAKKSNLKKKLDWVDMETDDLADLLCKIDEIEVNDSMNPFFMSQTYFRKAELISKWNQWRKLMKPKKKWKLGFWKLWELMK